MQKGRRDVSSVEPSDLSLSARIGPQAIAIVIFSVLLTGYLFGGNLFARWSIFDDHEIMWFLGRADRLPVSEIVPRMMQTELSADSTTPRFRPAYYALRLIESAAWGKHPGLWYGSHLGILLLFLIAVWLTASRRIGFVPAGLLSLYTLTFTFWSGIFSTLGPGETYATLGLGLFVIGFDRAWDDSGLSRGSLLLLLGTVCAAGSKENFIVLLIPWGVLMARAARRGNLRWLPAAPFGLAAAWSGWIAYSVIRRMQASGADVYGNPIGPGERLAVLLEALRDPRITPLYVAAGLLLLIWAWVRTQQTTVAGASLAGAGAVVLLAVLYVSQVIFYAGAWPTGTRYDLPGLLCWPLLLFVVSWYLLRLRAALPAASPYRAAPAAAVIIIGVLAVGSHFPNIPAIRAATARNIASTNAFTAFIGRLAAVAAQNPDLPIVIESGDPSDFEPIISYPRFLYAGGVTNPNYLIWIPARHGASNYQGSLSAQLRHLSREGAPREYLPIDQLRDVGRRCILLIITGTPRLDCEITLDANWRQFQ